ncbi:hypothetical protein VQ03_01970 [Methylobacterium tarhaniae]|uniref:Uncharacterized protein n=1 Tax=Methylobacterium tarhaniae TaxID=1187852 RepID=A0A0J6TFH8_9HYPH|nr:hypothetical protein VQ03_01970 [Methylobacterium tarhaniae]
METRAMTVQSSSDDDARRPRSLARVRNEIVHGGLGTAISHGDVDGSVRNPEAMAGPPSARRIAWGLIGLRGRCERPIHDLEP